MLLDKDLPQKMYDKYLIEEKEYEIVPVYDAHRCIVIKSDEDFLGKEV